MIRMLLGVGSGVEGGGDEQVLLGDKLLMVRGLVFGFCELMFVYFEEGVIEYSGVKYCEQVYV